MIRDDRDTVLLAGSHVYYKLAGMAVLAIAGRVLDEGELGRYFAAVGLVSPLAIVAHLGTSPLIARRVAQRGDARAFQPFLGVRAVGGAAYALVLAVVAAFAGPAWALVLAIGASEWLETMHGAFGALFVAVGRTGYNVLVGVVAQTLWVGAVAAAMAATPSVPGLIAADAVRALALCGLAAWLAHARLVRLRPRWDATIVREGLPFFALAVGNGAIAHLTTAAIGALARFEDASRFGLAIRVLFASVFVATLAGNVCARSLARSGATARMRALFAPRATLAVVAGLAVGGAFALLGEPVCVALYGAEHRGAGAVLAALGLAAPMWQWNAFVAPCLQAIGRERAVTIAGVTSGVVTIACLPVLVPAHGAIGGAIALAIGGLVHAVSLLWVAIGARLLGRAS